MSRTADGGAAEESTSSSPRLVERSAATVEPRSSASASGVGFAGGQAVPDGVVAVDGEKVVVSDDGEVYRGRHPGWW